VPLAVRLPSEGFDSVELFELAGARIEQLKQLTDVGDRHDAGENDA
jgi:hypothetical protein